MNFPSTQDTSTEPVGPWNGISEIVKAIDEKAARRKEAAKRVEDARKAAMEARKVYSKELEGFCKEFGAYHTTISDDEMADIFRSFWKDFLW